jgi:hypothetical protein
VEGQGFYVLCLKEQHARTDLLWWRPRRAGYTTSLESAGVYAPDEAYEICRSPADCAAIPASTALSLRGVAVTAQILGAMLAERADRQNGAVMTRADGPRTAPVAAQAGGPEHYRVSGGVSVVPHADMWRLEMRSGEVVPVTIEPARHRSTASARGFRAGGQSPYMATMQLALFASSTNDPVAGILPPGVADLATIGKAFRWVDQCEVDLRVARAHYETAKVGVDQMARLAAYSTWREAEASLASAQRLGPALLLTRVAAPPVGDSGPAGGPPEPARFHADCPTCTCGRRAAVQRDAERLQPGTVAWSEHLAAWGAYAAKHGREQSAERIHERGGFSYGELRTYLGHDPTTWQPAER